MARKSKEARHVDVFSEATLEYAKIQSALRDERLQCLQDRRFYSVAGAQWEGPLGEQFENRPRFEVNKIHLAVMRIISEYRNNRISVKFVSKDGVEHSLADACAGLYRADEQDSTANEAYDNAFEEAVGGGFGAWRVRTVYVDESDPDDERQRIRIEPIYDADSSVFFDLNAKRQDKSDARFCFVVRSMTTQSFIDEWDQDPTTWSKLIHQYEFDWMTPSVVYVAEYYRVEEVGEWVYTYRLLDGSEQKYSERDFDEDPELEDRLTATGAQETRSRRVKKRRVHKYIMSGGGILEDCGYIAGDQIPIVPVYGKRWFVDNVERCMGHVRMAKDAQRLKNMQLSRLGEISALSTVEKPIFTAEQVEGFENYWRNDNLRNYPYMLVNPLTDANGQMMPSGPIAFTKPPQIPPAMAALLQITESDMQDLLGNQQQGDKIVSNISEGAVDLIQQRLDMQSFIYVSNLAKSMRRCGEIWLSMAKEVYVEEGRKMKTVGIQGEVSSVELQRPTLDPQGKFVLENDLTEAEFDVDVDVGPQTATRKAAMVKEIRAMMTLTQDPETLQVLTYAALMNMEGEGLESLEDYFRGKLLKIGAVKPTDEEKQQLAQMAAQQQPDPQSLYLQSAAAEAQARAQKAQADTELAIAKAQQTKAQTVDTLAKIDQGAQTHAVETAKAIGEAIQPKQMPS